MFFLKIYLPQIAVIFFAIFSIGQSLNCHCLNHAQPEDVAECNGFVGF